MPLTLTPCDSLGCELEWVWTQLKAKLVGTAGRDVLNQVI